MGIYAIYISPCFGCYYAFNGEFFIYYSSKKQGLIMEIILWTNDTSFNAIFTIYMHLTILTAPLFASLALFTK